MENFDVIGAWRDNYRTSDRTVQKFTEVTTPEGNTYKFRVGPKVDAACHFATETGKTAAIGALADIAAIVRGDRGTIVNASYTDVTWH